MPKCMTCEQEFEDMDGHLDDDDMFTCGECTNEVEEIEAELCPRCHEQSAEFEYSGICDNCGYGSK